MWRLTCWMLPAIEYLLAMNLKKSLYFARCISETKFYRWALYHPGNRSWYRRMITEKLSTETMFKKFLPQRNFAKACENFDQQYQRVSYANFDRKSKIRVGVEYMDN